MTEKVTELEEANKELTEQLANSTAKPKGENVYVAPVLKPIISKEVVEAPPNL
jgi:hypothetical protein